MREIKFRGRLINSKKWIHGDYHRGIYSGASFIMGFIVEPESICQYTGLKDKNGVDIYEGDVVGIQRTKDIDDMEEYQIAIVHFIDKYASFIMNPTKNWCYTNWEQVEVVGNIHDNPELLKG